jgi:L,D-peptidoglycan transpeptidase YkuD (ErfK/YbiS/YcfS/YnhG family)
VPIGLRDGWSDDPRDPAYNRPVRRPHPFGHEALWRPDRLYDLVAVLDWNRGPVVPGGGSAIFLHVWRGPRRCTEGCIAFRRRDLAWILGRWTPRSRVVVRGWGVATKKGSQGRKRGQETEKAAVSA